MSHQGDDEIASIRRRAANAARSLDGTQGTARAFMNEFYGCRDRLVEELVDLIEHEPKRGGFMGAGEVEWSDYRRHIAEAIAALEAGASEYDEFRQRFIAALDAARRAQESRDLAAVEVGHKELDALLPRNAGPTFDKLHIALSFWDGWIDARNHDWLYYEGIRAEDWPWLARGIVDDLRNDHEISDQRVLKHFELRRQGKRPSFLAWLRRRILRRGGAV